MKSICSYPGCDRPVDAVIDGHGFCGDPRHRDHRQEVPLPVCRVPGCDYPANGHGDFCIHHPRGDDRSAA